MPALVYLIIYHSLGVWMVNYRAQMYQYIRCFCCTGLVMKSRKGDDYFHIQYAWSKGVCTSQDDISFACACNLSTQSCTIIFGIGTAINWGSEVLLSVVFLRYWTVCKYIQRWWVPILVCSMYAIQIFRSWDGISLPTFHLSDQHIYHHCGFWTARYQGSDV